MTYPSTWLASTDPTIESGEAMYTVDGEEYRMRLESFDDFMKISRMLDVTFKQGKAFASKAIRSHIERSLDDATIHHDL